MQGFIKTNFSFPKKARPLQIVSVQETEERVPNCVAPNVKVFIHFEGLEEELCPCVSTTHFSNHCQRGGEVKREKGALEEEGSRWGYKSFPLFPPFLLSAVCRFSNIWHCLWLGPVVQTEKTAT